jgi:hypothetical protein
MGFSQIGRVRIRRITSSLYPHAQSAACLTYTA